ncbi:MAG: TIGR03790 family protein, partial [Bryobacteraceae bacterium]
MPFVPRVLSCAFLAAALAAAQTPRNVLLVVNRDSPISRRIAEYYSQKRHIPSRNVCSIKTTTEESISRDTYKTQIAEPVAECLRSGNLQEQILYIVTTAGVPLRVEGSGGIQGDNASVDSELTLLYSAIRTGKPHATRGMVDNPFFGKRDAPFRHPAFPIYLVTRLAGYDFEDVQKMIDRSLAAKNRGKFVIDLNSGDDGPGNNWLRNAAILLPEDRVIADETEKVLYDQPDVIGLASWGSNDKNRSRRLLGFRWLPGAIATEYVSTNGRTFERPPELWNITSWKNKAGYFAGSPQTLTADYIHEGATGASGHVDEPYLAATPRPDFLLPAYY